MTGGALAAYYCQIHTLKSFQMAVKHFTDQPQHIHESLHFLPNDQTIDHSNTYQEYEQDGNSVHSGNNEEYAVESMNEAMPYLKQEPEFDPQYDFPTSLDGDDNSTFGTDVSQCISTYQMNQSDLTPFETEEFKFVPQVITPRRPAPREELQNMTLDDSSPQEVGASPRQRPRRSESSATSTPDRALSTPQQKRAIEDYLLKSQQRCLYLVVNNTCKIVKPDTQMTNLWDKIDGGTAVAYFRQIANILNVDVPNMDCIGMVLLQPASLDKPLEFVVWVVECLSNPAFKIRLTDLGGKTKKELEDLVYVLQGHAHNTSRKNKQPPSQATRNIVSQVLRTLTQYSTPGTDFILSSANATDRKSRSKIPI